MKKPDAQIGQRWLWSCKSDYKNSILTCIAEVLNNNDMQILHIIENRGNDDMIINLIRPWTRTLCLPNWHYLENQDKSEII